MANRKQKKVIFKGLKCEVYKDARLTLRNPKTIASGVYFITKAKKGSRRVLLYIGSCRCFAGRIASHEKLPQARTMLKEGERIEILFFDTEEYKRLESKFIFEYKPLFNKAKNWQRNDRLSRFFKIGKYKPKKVA